MSSPVQESGLCNILRPPGPDTSNDNELVDITAESSYSDNSSNNKTATVVVDTKDRPTLAVKMLNVCREIIIMVLIAAAYAALTNERPPKVSKCPAAYPFFTKNSLITDWYRGQITEAIEEARSSDLAFVMFYAPWDAESQAARKQLEFTAEVMHGQVTFAAINCWQPGSECKRQYSKVYKWPVLIAYPTHGRGIQYNGPLEAFHMIKFLKNVCKPLVRPHRIEDLINKYDTVVSANINVLPGSYEYAVYYSAALRLLERDPFRDTIFAILPNRYDSSPNLQLHVWNGTMDYTGDWNIDAISSWILKNVQLIAGWFASSGMKSLTLAGLVQPRPTLILFTPKNPLFPETDYFDMLREVSYEYHSCAKNAQVVARHELVRIERSKNRQNYQHLRRRCLQQPKHVITSVPVTWTNDSNKNVCNCVDNEPTIRVCPETEHSAITVDQRSPNYLQKFSKENECHSFLLAHKYAAPIFEKSFHESSVNISGFGCKTNLTLSFLAVDSLRLNHFAERLGVDTLSSPERTGVVIVNEKAETHYVMHGRLTSDSLKTFIHNFTQGILSRSLSSKVVVKTRVDFGYSFQNYSKSGEFFVAEWSSENFLHNIMQANKVVVVFYYSKQCSFCNGIAYTFLTVAKMLFLIEDIIFARIDGDTNLLPWEYTMESYPTILIFPANRKSESRAFPRNIPITVPNLMGFLLTNLEPVLKLRTMWAICSQAKFADEKMKCISAVRAETLTVIDKTLREWRNSTRKHKVLYKLQILRHLHLMFAHAPDQCSDIVAYLSKLKD